MKSHSLLFLKKIIPDKYLSIQSVILPFLLIPFLFYACGENKSDTESKPAAPDQTFSADPSGTPDPSGSNGSTIPPGPVSTERTLVVTDGFGAIPNGYLDESEREYTYLSFNGSSLGTATSPPGGVQYDCVLDPETNLVWENKSAENMAKVFTWEPLSNENVSPGVAVDSNDNSTKTYIDNLNSNEHCGKDSWRVPTDVELLTLYRETPHKFIFFQAVTRLEQDIVEPLRDASVFTRFTQFWRRIIGDKIPDMYPAESLRLDYVSGAMDSDSAKAGPLMNFAIYFHFDPNMISAASFTPQRFEDFNTQGDMLDVNQRFLSTVSLEEGKNAVLLGVPFGAVYHYDTTASETEDKLRKGFLITQTAPYIDFHNLSYKIYKVDSSSAKIQGHLIAVAD